MSDGRAAPVLRGRGRTYSVSTPGSRRQDQKFALVS
ncbi:hypothetical protein Ae150APs1_4309c [Pseudonocardia sp. Ae150A_Ps1]|nr:hypothetical protein Ae150APs1_4309c [Pseudonocardia sp. Ae150A_Ps1]